MANHLASVKVSQSKALQRKHAHGPSYLLLAVRLVANNAGVLDVSSPDMSWSVTIS